MAISDLRSPKAAVRYRTHWGPPQPAVLKRHLPAPYRPWHEAPGEPTLADAILDRLVPKRRPPETAPRVDASPARQDLGGPGAAAMAGASEEPDWRVADYPVRSWRRSPEEGVLRPASLGLARRRRSR